MSTQNPTPSDLIRVLIVDDTSTYRMILSNVVKQFPKVTLEGTTANGSMAIEFIKETPVDLILLDVEMPVMNGMETLNHLLSIHPDLFVVMISSPNPSTADLTIAALNRGAKDFIVKPDEVSAEKNMKLLQERLNTVITSISYQKNKRKLAALSTQNSAVLTQALPKLLPKVPIENKTTPLITPAQRDVSVRTKSRTSLKRQFKALAIGVSTGGPNALSEMLPELPGDLGVPIFIVQHMPAVFTASLAKSLNQKCRLTVKEAEHGETVEINTVYIAPGNFHMVAEKKSQAVQISLNQDIAENSCRPSVDVLFRSLVPIYHENILSLIMTGMGSDGALGVKAIKEANGYCITQSAESCVVYGMPKQIDDWGLSDQSVSLNEMARTLSAHILETTHSLGGG
ncbi:MAG: chemotaxis-specific protein-glutamate methyltransferase CheB [Cyanobacteria bacterium]|nr:chemotaxis-specific protein-glutamate methyltransferase CheB [Cyanobacteriota bacterium]